jgi:hypothetical protein
MGKENSAVSQSKIAIVTGGSRGLGPQYRGQSRQTPTTPGHSLDGVGNVEPGST